MCRFFAPEICNNAILSSAISVIYNNTPLYAEGEMDVTYAKEFEKGTFDSFRAGKANALAVKMIREAVNHPDLYNPVLIYGQAGTGKTHLLHAMADEMLQAHPDWHVELIHCADLTNQLISHIMDGKTKEFRDFFMQVDAILVDDIHILSGKQATQEEMLRVLDVLMCNGKQVVMTADRHPRQILAVQDQLRSRFHGGLLLELYAPDLEARQAIAEAYAAENWNLVLNPEYVILLASRISSVRNLRGATAKLCAYIKMAEALPTMEEAMKITESYWTAR